MNEIENLNNKLEKLKNMNIKLSLDDFGTVYNSIRYLSEFSFDVVKIDKSYIYKLIENHKFVSAIIKMIHSIGSKVVSEGIESEEQVEMLKDLGTDIMQGYFFYIPLNFNELLLKMTNDILKLLAKDLKRIKLKTIV